MPDPWSCPLIADSKPSQLYQGLFRRAYASSSAMDRRTRTLQTSLYQLFLDRKYGEGELLESASLIACSNRETDRSAAHRMSTPLNNRHAHHKSGSRRRGPVRLVCHQRDRNIHFQSRQLDFGELSVRRHPSASLLGPTG